MIVLLDLQGEERGNPWAGWVDERVWVFGLKFRTKEGVMFSFIDSGPCISVLASLRCDDSR